MPGKAPYRLRILLSGIACAVLLAAPAFPQSLLKPWVRQYMTTAPLVEVTLAPPKTFNPVVANETSSTGVLRDLFEGLTRRNPLSLEYEPEIAERWEASEDGKVWTVHLRQGVKFFDGVELTAADVLFTYNDLYFNRGIAGNSQYDLLVLDGKPIFRVEMVDRYIVRFLLERAVAGDLMLNYMASSILPKHKLEKPLREAKFEFTWSIATPPSEIIGTGPFKFARYDAGVRVVYQENPLWWRKARDPDLPLIKEKLREIKSDQDVMLVYFKSGEPDRMGLNADQFAELKPLEGTLNKAYTELADRFRKAPSEAQRQELLKLENQKFTIYDIGPTTSSQFLVLNQNPRAKALKPWLQELFTDVHFRQALAHAIDRESIVLNVLNTLGQIAHGPVSPAVKKFYHPHLRTYDYDPVKARKMLEGMGWRDTDGDGYLDKVIEGKKERLEFTLETNSGNREREAICTILLEDFKKVGIKINYRPADFNALVTKLMDTFAWEAIVIGLTGGPEPLEGKNVWLSSGHLHMWNPRQPEPGTDWEREIDEIFKRAPYELDPQKRIALAQRWQQIVSEQLPYVPLILPTTQVAYRERIAHKVARESLMEIISIFGIYQEEQLIKRLAQ